MKRLLIVFAVVGIAGCGSTPQMSDEEVSKHAVVNTIGDYAFLKLDGRTTWTGLHQQIVTPGRHNVEIARFSPSGQVGASNILVCDTEANHVYEVGPLYTKDFECKDIRNRRR